VRGLQVFFSFEDSDKEAAYWAKQNKAYAIITDDTDFLCYDGVDRIWAANMKLPTTRSKRPLAASSAISAAQCISVASSTVSTPCTLGPLNVKTYHMQDS
jgi:hypothetical protein